MSKFLRTQLFPSMTSIKDPATKNWAQKLMSFLDTTFRNIADIPFNNSNTVTVADTGNADAEFTAAHYLGRAPNGYILVKTDKAANIYDGDTTWTTTTIYLKCDVANAAVTLLIY